jgi:hypothetical protein
MGMPQMEGAMMPQMGMPQMEGAMMPQMGMPQMEGAMAPQMGMPQMEGAMAPQMGMPQMGMMPQMGGNMDIIPLKQPTIASSNQNQTGGAQNKQKKYKLKSKDDFFF